MAVFLGETLFGWIVTFLLGRGLYFSYRTGTFTLLANNPQHVTYRRTDEPVLYWVSMSLSALSFVVVASLSLLMLVLSIRALLFGPP